LAQPLILNTYKYILYVSSEGTIAPLERQPSDPPLSLRSLPESPSVLLICTLCFRHFMIFNSINILSFLVLVERRLLSPSNIVLELEQVYDTDSIFLLAILIHHACRKSS
jgi:hypothetical protein